MRLSGAARARTGRGLRVGLGVRLAAATSLLAIAIAFLVSASSTQVAVASTHEELRSKLAAVAASTAANVDVEWHRAVDASRDEDSREYRALKAYLAAVRDANPQIRHVYTMSPGEQGDVWHFVVDAEDDPELLSHSADPYDVSPYPELVAGLQGPSADRAITHDEWGSWLSGYAPIRDEHGTAIGIVGVDMSAAAVAAQIASLQRSLLGTAALAVLLAVLTGIALGRILTQPLGVLVACAERVAQGDLEVRADISRQDEIGELAARFNQMVEGLRERVELLRLANTDTLTGLHNHRHGQELLAREIQRAQRHGHSLGILVLDVDDFKLINDSFGHVEGDRVLRLVAERLSAAVRSTDIVSRYGGDEFLIILPETDAYGAAAAARRITQEIAGCAYTDAYGRRIPITGSIGSAVYPTDSGSQRQLISTADAAMYEVKRAGGRGYRAADLSSSDMLAAQNSTFGVLESLVQAIDVKDRYTRRHAETVTKLSLAVAGALQLPEEIRTRVRIAGLLHDIGKIGVPTELLRKPVALNEAEQDSVKEHSVLGAMIVQEVPHLAEVVAAIRHHHERYDGEGYPQGLKGEDIPLAARILAIADAYSAMVSDRQYRKGLPVAEAIEELRRGAGQQFDPNLVEVFIQTIARDPEHAQPEPELLTA